jgi:predicted TIM-barrel fold metal-dependent hydrolase
LFGSDFPYVHGDVLEFEIQQLDELDVFDDTTREAMLRTNAIKLFPRLRKSKSEK